MSVGNIASDNDGVQYLLVIIDVFSRKLRVEALKNKTAKSVLDAMRRVISRVKPRKIRSDKGTEFTNRWFRSYMKENDIYFFTTNNQAKASVAERVQRTIKTHIYRILRHQRTYRYIDQLQDILRNYNATPNRSLGYIAPSEVTKANESDVWAQIYLCKKSHAK